MNFSVFYRGSNGAIRFVVVAAIAELAIKDQRRDFREVAVQFFGLDIP
jgi:hypothetical protein